MKDETNAVIKDGQHYRDFTWFLAKFLPASTSWVVSLLPFHFRIMYTSSSKITVWRRKYHISRRTIQVLS